MAKSKTDTADPVEETAERDEKARQERLEANPQYGDREDPETPGTAENDAKLAAEEREAFLRAEKAAAAE